MAKRVQLSHPQFYAFVEWMKKNEAELFVEAVTYKAIAIKAQDELGFAVSDYSVKGALEISGLIEKYLAANGKAVPLETKQLRLIAEQLKAVCVSLGIPLLPGIEEIGK